MGTGNRRALPGTKGPAVGAGGCWRALAGRGREEGAGGELWAGAGWEERAGGGHWPVEAPRGTTQDGGAVLWDGGAGEFF